MTTDVINNVPRELLERIDEQMSTVWESFDPVRTELRALLATAQPAADGEREAFEAAYAAECERELRNGTTATDIANLRVGDGYGSSNTHLNAQWIGWQKRAAPQAPARHDQANEVRRLREALERARYAVERGEYATGCCCCGNSVASHGLGDGHSPVDEGDYFKLNVLKDINAALTQSPKGEEE